MCGICVIIFQTDSNTADSSKRENELATLNLLRNRGPDIKGNIIRSIDIENKNQENQSRKRIQLDFHGCVLHLRGSATKQPLEDSFGNILLWNGEIFGGSFQVSESQNDGEQLMNQLSKISFDKINFEENVVKVFQNVHGPWAFIYWQNTRKELWFGRDFFGRRSLLWHFPDSYLDDFALSSVAMRCPNKTWHEVPASSLYKISYEDISRFYADNLNEQKLQDSIRSIPLHLPQSDFRTSAEEVLERLDSPDTKNIDSRGDERRGDQEVSHKYKGNINGELLKEEDAEIPSFLSSKSIDSIFGTKCCFCGGNEIINDISSTYNEYNKNLTKKLNNSEILENIERDDSFGLMSTNATQPIKCNCLHHVVLPQLKSNPPDSDSLISDQLLDFYVNNFMIILEEATRRRVYNLPRDEDLAFSELDEMSEKAKETGCKAKKLKIPKVGILFSGGIDCMTLAAMADRVLPEDEPIDLLNVAFAQQIRPTSCSKRNKNPREEINKDPYDVPDRITGRSGVKELNPKRIWNFIEVNITLEEVKQAREQRVQHLLNPLETVLDDSIGCAIWFAARGNGIQYQLRDQELVKCSYNYHSPVKVLLTGMGADEQLGGYARHRSKFEKFGWSGLESEIKMETERISSRNLGRDDRCTSDHGREARFPFLDENVVSFLENVPIWIRCDPRLPRGHGEKRLLRRMATRLNLTGSVSLPKRAIQFGSRIAKLENNKEKGSDSCNRLVCSAKT